MKTIRVDFNCWMPGGLFASTRNSDDEIAVGDELTAVDGDDSLPCRVTSVRGCSVVLEVLDSDGAAAG